MSPERYLKRYFRIRREMGALLERLSMYKKEEELLSKIDPLGVEMVETREYIRKSHERIEKYSSELEKVEDTVIGMISALDTPQEREVLTYRYLDGMRWEDIAEKMYYAEDTLYNWHKRALEHLKYPVN